MVTQKILKGITWNHSRGYIPMIATAQRFMELNAGVQISWSKRSLQDFADKPIGQLAEDFDLLVLDHPWIGYGAEEKKFLPLDKLLSTDFLEDQKANSVGKSFESYVYDDQTWAIPIDAATPVASFRPDLMKKHGLAVPGTFDQLLDLARQGKVIMPGIAIDTLMNFFMFCASLGEEPFLVQGQVVSEKSGLQALALYKSLTDRIDPLCFGLNPIKVYERMSTTDDYLYCPFAYGYSNYARTGYTKSKLQFTDIVSLESTTAQPMTSTLGGTGLAISSRCVHKETAIQYLEYVASADCQEGLYFDSGGQPAHLKAWHSPCSNIATDQFFINTLPALKRAYLRPRHNGYIHFQDHGGDIIRNYLMQGGNPREVLLQLHQLLNSHPTWHP